MDEGVCRVLVQELFERLLVVGVGLLVGHFLHVGDHAHDCLEILVGNAPLEVVRETEVLPVGALYGANLRELDAMVDLAALEQLDQGAVLPS